MTQKPSLELKKLSSFAFGVLVNDVMIGGVFSVLMTSSASNEPISWLKVLLDSRL